MDSQTLKTNVQTYSALGLVPFVALGALLPLWPEIYQFEIQQSFVEYAAIILAFMGGALWLPAITGDQKKTWHGTTIAILASLIAFLAMLLPTSVALLLTASGFLLLLFFELVHCWLTVYPNWYGTLRLYLTSCVVLCHLLLGMWTYP